MPQERSQEKATYIDSGIPGFSVLVPQTKHGTSHNQQTTPSHTLDYHGHRYETLSHAQAELAEDETIRETREAYERNERDLKARKKEALVLDREKAKLKKIPEQKALEEQQSQKKQVEAKLEKIAARLALRNQAEDHGKQYDSLEAEQKKLLEKKGQLEKMSPKARSLQEIDKALTANAGKTAELEAAIKQTDTAQFKSARQKKSWKQHETAVAKTKAIAKKLFAPGTQLGKESLVDQRYPNVAFHQVNDGLYFFPGTTLPQEEYDALYTQGAAQQSITRVIMNGCLFGASIEGWTQTGRSFPLIDHDLRVNNPKKAKHDSETQEDQYAASSEFEARITNIITSTRLNSIGLHPYETMMLSAFEALLPVIKTLSKNPAEPPIIHYHLPVIDYMLYGVHLFIQGKMDYHALNTYVEEVKARAALHEDILRKLAHKSGVTIRIESPFNNLLDPNKEITASVIADTLSQLTPKQHDNLKKELPFPYETMVDAAATMKRDRDPHLMDLVGAMHSTLSFWKRGRLVLEEEEISQLEKAPLIIENMFVDNLLKLLQSNTYYPEHAATWRDIVQKGVVTRFSPLQALFEAANTSMIAFAAHEEQKLGEKNGVCVLLPVDEGGPIVGHYTRSESATSFRQEYGDITSLFWLPPVLSSINCKEDLAHPKNTNNLFRLRLNQNAPDEADTRAVMTERFALPDPFWNIMDQCIGEYTEKQIQRAQTPPPAYELTQHEQETQTPGSPTAFRLAAAASPFEEAASQSCNPGPDDSSTHMEKKSAILIQGLFRKQPHIQAAMQKADEQCKKLSTLAASMGMKQESPLKRDNPVWRNFYEEALKPRQSGEESPNTVAKYSLHPVPEETLERDSSGDASTATNSSEDSAFSNP